MLWLGEAAFARAPGARLLAGGVLARTSRELAFADPGTARAWRLLRRGPLPTEIQRSLDAEGNRVLGKLVLDGWLSIEGPGGFVSGPEASALVLGNVSAPLPVGPLGRLSRLALDLAAALPPMSTRARAARLYQFNTHPAPPGWKARFSSDRDVEVYLRGAGLTPRGWVRGGGDRRGWLQWSRPATAGAAFKLYLSPHPERMIDTVRLLLREVPHLPVTAFKVGCTRAGMLRSDRVVVYFSRKLDALRTGRILARELAGTEAAGVPFTAAIDRTGLVSWGADVHRASQARGGRMDSWRSWIASFLARAIESAIRSPSADFTAIEFALLRLQLEGIDTRRFAPRTPFLRTWGLAVR